MTATQVPSTVRASTRIRRSAWWILAYVSVVAGVVLRVWSLGAHKVTVDETFTGAAARRPVDELFNHLRSVDAHPPLDYLLRAPFTGAADDAVLRIPSVVFSVATLVLFVHWMRDRKTFGAVAVTVAAFLPFLILHGREARMYSGVMFLGVVAAMAAERWLQRPGIRPALVVAGAGLLASLMHSAALVPLGALILLPGLRRDRKAWAYRASIAGALLMWCGLWGPSLLAQARAENAGWIPLSSAGHVEVVAAALVSPRAAFVHLSALLLAIGLAAFVARHHTLGLIASLTFIVPFVAVVIVGAKYPLLLPRTFAFGAWVPVVGIAAAVDELRRRLGGPAAALGLAVVAALIVPSAVETVREPRESRIAFDVLQSRLRPGDRISLSPSRHAPLLEWEFVAKQGFEVVGVVGGRFEVIDRSGPPSGRVHLLDHNRLPIDEEVAAGTHQCGERHETSSWLLRCVIRR